MPAAKLLVREGPLAGQRLALDREVVVGRENADITIGDPELSRQHALMRLREGALEIQDLGSLNGTWVNGRRVDTTILAPGDLVKLGDSVLEVEEAPAAGAERTQIAAPATPPAAPAAHRAPAPAAAHDSAPAPAAANPTPPAAPFTAPAARRRRAAATRLAAPAFLSLAAIVATAVALIVYFAQH